MADELNDDLFAVTTRAASSVIAAVGGAAALQSRTAFDAPDAERGLFLQLYATTLILLVEDKAFDKDAGPELVNRARKVTAQTLVTAYEGLRMRHSDASAADWFAACAGASRRLGRTLEPSGEDGSSPET